MSFPFYGSNAGRAISPAKCTHSRHCKPLDSKRKTSRALSPCYRRLPVRPLCVVTCRKPSLMSSRSIRKPLFLLWPHSNAFSNILKNPSGSARRPPWSLPDCRVSACRKRWGMPWEILILSKQDRQSRLWPKVHRRERDAHGKVRGIEAEPRGR
jgi:hypothetical protein